MAVLQALCALAVLGGASAGRASETGANPIRKVVTLMQNMQKEIEETGKKEKELFDKFMCYCSNNNGALAKSIEDGKAKIEELSAKLKSEAAEKSQNEQDLTQHKKDREAAASDLAEATSLREKEAAEFAEEKADSETNIKAMAGAIPMLEKGMGGASLLQTPGGGRLQKIVDSFPFTDEMDRRNVVSFFEQSGDYVPQSGQIVGILKQMKESMEASLTEAVADEEKAVTGFGELKASKEQEQEAATTAIETKQTRAGELAVSVVTTQDDMEDTEEEVADTEKFAKQLEEQCGTKEKEWAEREKLRAEEIAAISDAIGILNDDDALDVFKKAMPSALIEEKAGFLQRSGSQAQATSRLHRVKAILAPLAKGEHSKLIKLMLFSLNSKVNMLTKLHRRGKVATGNFEEVQKMVDDMVVLEGKEQASDDTQMPWCNGEFDKSAREEKAEKNDIDMLEAEIDQDKDGIEAANAEVAALKAEIMELDKAVVEATEQRKDEHEDYTEELSLTSTAVELVKKAKNRLQKFYNPTLYKSPDEVKERTMEEKIIDAGSFAQLRRSDVAPPPAPETFGAYEKSTEKSAGVLGLMDMIVKELEDDMKDAEYEEKTAQADYEKLMTDSAETRAEKAKSITDKQEAKAKLQAKKVQATMAEKVDFKDVDSIHEYQKTLHGSCDFIMENFDARKEARAQEVESLKNAKAVLAGAKM